MELVTLMQGNKKSKRDRKKNNKIFLNQTNLYNCMQNDYIQGLTLPCYVKFHINIDGLFCMYRCLITA